MTVKTLLFDLDGTLLPFDQRVFMEGYFKALIPQIIHLVDKEQIIGQIMKSTSDMVANEDPLVVNIDAFKQSFFSSTDIREVDIWPIFESFYETTFADLHHLTKPSPISREICRTAIEKGYQLVLATNPVFPTIAVRHRMQWAGISDIPFALVTTMEEMHFCKPNPKYYVEIMDKLDATPGECIMIGNDVQEDGVAGKLGMDTFLVNDYAIDRQQGHVEFTHAGNLQDVLSFVQDLPNLVHRSTPQWR
jgi:FMN phosphatase YigB (HAD superfamily)